MTQLKDVIHLYLGCEVRTPDGYGWLKSVNYEPNRMPSNRVSVKFLKMIATKNCIDGGYDRVRSYGDYLLMPEKYAAMATSEDDFDSFQMPGGVRLILRPLSDITEEEIKELFFIKYKTRPKNITRVGIVDLFIQIEYENDGKTGSDYQVLNTMYPLQQAYLLKQGFDLFGLIESGQAIQKLKPQ